MQRNRSTCSLLLIKNKTFYLAMYITCYYTKEIVFILVMSNLYRESKKKQARLLYHLDIIDI